MRACVVMFYDNNISDYGDINYKINKLYCEKYNLDLILSQEKTYIDKHSSYEKLPLILKHIENYDYIIWIDSDAFFYLNSNNIIDIINNNLTANFIFSKDITENNINCGILIVKNTKYSIEFINKWAYDEYLYKNNSNPLWWEQGILNNMIESNILDIKNNSFSYGYGVLQHFNKDELSTLPNLPFIYHLAGKSNEVRIKASNNYYNSILYNLDFNLFEPTVLCEIMGRNKSDKGNLNNRICSHNYTKLYHHIFKDIKNEKLRIFELGVGTNNIYMPSNMGYNGRPGASLYGWAEYFPNSKVYGADIDSDILFNTDSIKTYYCDQRNPNIIKYMWKEEELLEPFDIIIEDGLHEFNANVIFFENSIYKLAKNGYFIIEDINNNEISLFNDKINDWKIKYKDILFMILEIPYHNKKDNNLFVAKRI